MKRLNQKGFTILELVIATSVFGIMMLLSTAGILQIGKIYYKGITTSRTQEATRAIVDDLFQTFQTSYNSTLAYSFVLPPGPSPTFPDEGAVCVGKTRYTYRLNQKIDGTNQHALWVDRITGTTCSKPDLNSSVPTDPNSDTSDLGVSNRRELLAENMRLADFQIHKISDKVYSISVKIIYGDSDLSPDDQTCVPINQGGQFCAISSLDTFVKKRLD